VNRSPAKGILNGCGVLGNHYKQDARWPFRLAMTLFPVLNRIQRKTKLRGKLSLTQPHPGTQFSHVHPRRWNVGDSHTDWLALHPVAGLLCASQQLLAQYAFLGWLPPAGSLHFSFFSLQSDFSARSCLVRAARCRVDKSVWTLLAKIAIRNKGTSVLWK
jgi:hypothetical protein